MPEVAAQPQTQPELPLQKPQQAPSKAARFEIPPDADIIGITPSKPAAPEKPAEAKPAATNTAESAPATQEGETPAVPEDDTPEQAAKREERRRQNKLEKAYRQRAEAKARADLAEKMLAEERAKSSTPKPVDGEPRLEQFDYDPEKYAAAKADFAKKQAEKDFIAKQQSESQKQFREKLTSSWEEKVDRAADKYDDFSEVVGDITPDTPMAAAIMEAGNGADIAHYLGKHRKEAERIAALHPLAQIREIGRLEEKLSAQPEKPKTPSKAPAPITPLAGTNVAASPEPSESDDMASWMKKRQKQVHGRR